MLDRFGKTDGVLLIPPSFYSKQLDPKISQKLQSGQRLLFAASLFASLLDPSESRVAQEN